MSEPTERSGGGAERAAALCAVLAGGLAGAVLLAWMVAGEAGLELGLGDAPMSPLGAVALLFLAAALWLRRGGGAARAGVALALPVVVYGVVNLIGHLSGGLTQWSPLARVSFIGAVGLIATASAVAGLDLVTRRGRRPTHALAVLAAVLSALAALAHLYGIGEVLQVGEAHALAPHSTAAIGLLALGVLMARRGEGALHVLAADGQGGRLARRLLPIVVLVPPGLDALRLAMVGDDAGGFAAGVGGQALQTSLVVLMLGGTVWWSAARINEAEVQRREVDEALRSSERRVREIVESLPQLVWTCAPDGACDYLSPQWIRYTGRPEAEQLGSRWLEQVHPEDRAGVAERWRETVAAGRPFDVEFRIRRSDGEHRWFKTRAEPLRDAEGRIVKWFGTNTDIDDQRRAEQVLREAHDVLEQRVRERTAELAVLSSRLRAAIEVASLGVWEWEPATGVLNWDAKVRELHGAGPDEAVSFEDWLSAVEDEDRETVKHGAQAAGRGFHGVFRIRRRDGTRRFVESRALWIGDERGGRARLVGVHRDITEEREAEERLRASEGLLSEFVRHAPAAIAMLDRELCYLRVSERWVGDLGLGAKAEGGLTGHRLHEVLPSLPPPWREAHRRVLGGAVERAEEERFRLPDGRVEWLQWEARPWRDGKGEVGGVLLFAQIITARKRLELELRRQGAELERSNRDLEHFASVASHDLQEPLRAVAGCLQLLVREHGEKLDPGARELVEHAVDGARRMRALILDLLTYSKVGAGEPQRGETPLAEPYAEALANLGAAIAESGAEVTCDAELPVLACDRGLVVMLLQNLLGNAIKYRHPGRPPRVHLGVERSAGGVVVSVRDNGIGVEPRFHERIFDIFQRLHTRREHPGNGIGLALCKKIVERHGGRIWVESRPGEGSTFKFTLQAQEAA